MQASDNKGYLNIIDEISNLLSNPDEKEEVESYLQEVYNRLRAQESNIEIESSILRIYLLQRITRSEGKRKNAVKFITKLLLLTGEKNAKYFENFIQSIEDRLNKSGLSYLDK